jgi:hypothetical protein
MKALLQLMNKQEPVCAVHTDLDINRQSDET